MPLSLKFYLQQHQLIRQLAVPLHLLGLCILVQLDSDADFLKFDLQFVCFVLEFDFFFSLRLELSLLVLDLRPYVKIMFIELGNFMVGGSNFLEQGLDISPEDLCPALRLGEVVLELLYADQVIVSRYH